MGSPADHLSKFVKNTQSKAMYIILPGLPYEEALHLANLKPFSSQRTGFLHEIDTIHHTSIYLWIGPTPNFQFVLTDKKISTDL